jgi:hypothetical protein
MADPPKVSDRQTLELALIEEFCGDKCQRGYPCYACPIHRATKPGFEDMQGLLKGFLRSYPDSVFTRNPDYVVDVGHAYVDLLKDAVEFLDAHPEGRARKPGQAEIRVGREVAEYVANNLAGLHGRFEVEPQDVVFHGEEEAERMAERRNAEVMGQKVALFRVQEVIEKAKTGEKA